MPRHEGDDRQTVIIVDVYRRFNLRPHEGGDEEAAVNHGDGSGDHFLFAIIFVLLRKRHPSVLQAGEYQRRSL